MCKISGSNSQNRRGHLDFCTVKYESHDVALQLLGFGVYSILGVKIDFVGPTQSVLRIFARNFEQSCLGAPGSGWSTKYNGPFFFSYSKCPSIVYLFEGL